MTTCTKRNKICELICRLVITRREKAKWLYVVDIQRAIQFLFMYSTKLATPFVSFTGFAGLPNPVRTVVQELAASPAWIVFSTPIFSFPCTKARSITKHIFLLLYPPIRSNQISLALSTFYFIVLMFFAGRFANKCFCHAFTRAVFPIGDAAPVCRWTIERFAAGVAFNCVVASLFACWYWNKFSRFNSQTILASVLSCFFFAFVSHVVYSFNAKYTILQANCQTFMAVGSEVFETTGSLFE